MEKLKNQVIKLLSSGEWYSNYQINTLCKSGSADRVMRFIRQKPPTGFKVVSRKKELPETYRRCYEYKLVMCEDEQCE